MGIMDIWILLAMWSSFSIFSFLSLIALKRIWLLATALIIRNRSTSPSSWRILMKLLSLSRLANISFSGMNTLIAQQYHVLLAFVRDQHISAFSVEHCGVELLKVIGVFDG